MNDCALFLAAAVLSVVELDVSSAGQFMISRPIVLGPLAGAALGEPLLGAGFGALYEFFSLAAPPVGGHLPINPTVALSAGLLLGAGGGAALGAAFSGGLLFGMIHSRVEIFLRQRRIEAVRIVERRLALAEEPRIGVVAVKEMLLQASATLAILSLAVVLRSPLKEFTTGWLAHGLRFGLSAAPWISLGALYRALRLA